MLRVGPREKPSSLPSSAGQGILLQQVGEGTELAGIWSPAASAGTGYEPESRCCLQRNRMELWSGVGRVSQPLGLQGAGKVAQLYSTSGF